MDRRRLICRRGPRPEGEVHGDDGRLKRLELLDLYFADARRVGLASAALIPKPDADRVRRLATPAAPQGVIGAGDQPIELAEAGIAANGDLVGALGLRTIETRGRGYSSGWRSR
jgi:hypothetical protein